jgi:hypothetical protein
MEYMQAMIDVPSAAQERLLLMMYEGTIASGDEQCLYKVKCLAAQSAYEATRRAALEILCQHIAKQAAELKSLRPASSNSIASDTQQSGTGCSPGGHGGVDDESK